MQHGRSYGGSSLVRGRHAMPCSLRRPRRALMTSPNGYAPSQRFPWVVRCTICQGATVALTLMRLQLPQVDLGAVALGVPEDTSDRALEVAEDAMAPLVATVANIVDDGSLLVDEYPDEEGAPTNPPASP